MRRFAAIIALLAFSACGLAEDERDYDNQFVYLTFSDAVFETWCLERFDLNSDGRISRYEAQRVRTIDCSGCGIGELSRIEEFTRLEKLVCRGNSLTMLDLRKCTDLALLDCGSNALVSLDLDGLRGLTTLDCSDNRLVVLGLQSAVSLRQLDCRFNSLVTLDLKACSSNLGADVRNNPSLTTVYALPSQNVNSEGPTDVVR